MFKKYIVAMCLFPCAAFSEPPNAAFSEPPNAAVLCIALNVIKGYIVGGKLPAQAEFKSSGIDWILESTGVHIVDKNHIEIGPVYSQEKSKYKYFYYVYEVDKLDECGIAISRAVGKLFAVIDPEYED